MAGIHADRGDLSHRIASGEAPTEGLRVWTNDLRRATITELDARNLAEPCGWYCKAWHSVREDGAQHTTIMNCERLSTFHPATGERA